MLEIQDLTTAYGPVVAVSGASLKVEPGQAVAIIGANGAGKTTLLKTICGLLRPSAGSISFEGKALGGMAAYTTARTGVLMVPEGRQILGSLSVEENLELGGRAAAKRGGSPSEDKDRVFGLFPILAERRRQPELSRVQPVEQRGTIENEFEIGLTDDDEEDAARNSRMNRIMQGVARQASLDPADGMDL